MKKNILLFIAILCSVPLMGQFGGAASSCYVNANAHIQGNLVIRNIPKRATFKINFKLAGASSENCTGTLINRNTTQNGLGFYFITAGHCFTDTDLSDPNKEFDLIFNYESPTSESNSTPISNRGAKTNSQPPTNIQSLNTSDNGFQYIHRSKLRLVVENKFRDFALFEVLKPIPPHFNVAYAGWNPSFAFNLSPINGQFNYTVFQHPLNDIKKISTTSTAIALNPLEGGCRIITKVIDLAFGWIWNRNKLTEAYCSNLSLGRVFVSSWSAGSIDFGSSGSSLINNTDKIVGVLGADVARVSCHLFGNVVFNRLQSNYYNESVRSVFNPSKNFWVDQLGIDGSLITCHSSLNNLSGEYFAGKDYNSNSGIVSNNKTTLQSATTITTNGTLRIHPGAEYVFVSPNGIVLNPGFEILTPTAGETIGVIEIKPGSCVVPRSDNNSNNIPYSILEKAKNLQLPKYKPFNLNLDNSIGLTTANSIQVFPNPNDGDFTIRFKTETKGNVELSFTDILGRSILKTTFNTIQGENFYPLNFNERKLQAGIYFIILTEGENKRVEKVVIK